MLENRKSFREMYDEIWGPARQSSEAAKEFIRRCAAATYKSEGTVRAWLSGAYVPDELARMALAKEFGVDPDALFPERPTKKEVESINEKVE